MLQTQQAKQLVYELTLEYIKQNNILKCKQENIADQIHKIAEISREMSYSIEKEYHNISFF